MNIINYFIEIENRINKINHFINRYKSSEKFTNPFLEILPHTYVWIEKDDDIEN